MGAHTPLHPRHPTALLSGGTPESSRMECAPLNPHQRRKGEEQCFLSTYCGLWALQNQSHRFSFNPHQALGGAEVARSRAGAGG